MKAVVTRVSEASVTIDGSVVGSIGKGFLILLGVGPEDTSVQCKKLAEKVLGLRVFEDENGKMNLDLAAVGGQVLVVSSSPSMPTFPTVAAHPSPVPPIPPLPSPSMNSSCRNALTEALSLSTESLAQI